MSQAIKDFKGYAVGGDDTEWRKFLSARFDEIMNESSAESYVSADIKSSDVDNEDFINAMSSFVDVTQNVIGDITISHSPKSGSVGQIKTDIIRGLV
jgi:hypothetical protein